MASVCNEKHSATQVEYNGWYWLVPQLRSSVIRYTMVGQKVLLYCTPIYRGVRHHVTGRLFQSPPREDRR